MSRVAFFALVALFTAATTSIASAGCCGWGVQAPITYAPAGCGGCGAPSAAIVYAAPVAPAPPPVAVGWGWGAGCGCHRAFVYAATPAIQVTPVAVAPIYVVDQGPDYTGPGIMVPYHTWTPSASYVVRGSYPYVAGYGYRGYRYGYHSRWGYGYGWRRPLFAPRVRVSYGSRFYGHPFYHRPAWGPAMHRYYR